MYRWVELQKIGVFSPQNGWFMIYNGKPFSKWDDLGKPTIFGNIHMYLYNPNITLSAWFFHHPHLMLLITIQLSAQFLWKKIKVSTASSGRCVCAYYEHPILVVLNRDPVMTVYEIIPT